MCMYNKNFAHTQTFSPCNPIYKQGEQICNLPRNSRMYLIILSLLGISIFSASNLLQTDYAQLRLEVERANKT